MTKPPQGMYHGRGWTVDVGEDAEAEAVVVASIHEAMHDRLQMTTAYGLLLDRFEEEQSAMEAAQSQAARRGCTRTHEEFATWMSCISAGWTAVRLRAAFPVYERHLKRADRRVRSLAGPYLGMHATQAVARSCMQSPAVADILATGNLGAEDLTRLTRWHRPDWRLARLEASIERHGWGPLNDWPGPSSRLEPELFAEENDAEWGELNRAAYDWCATLLVEAGCPTLPYDGHLPFVRAGRLTAAASTGMSPSRVALMSVESEAVVLGDHLPAVVLPPGTDLAEMLAGGEQVAHFFLAIRPRERVVSQYVLLAGELPPSEHLAMLRCQRDDGTVELLDVSGTDPARMMQLAPVVASVSMTSAARPEISDRWRPILRPGVATVLADQRLSVNLPSWLEPAGRRLRYSVFGVETRVGWMRVLAFRVESDTGGRSRTYLTPVSRLYDAGLRLMFAETPEFARRTVFDLSIANEKDVRVSVAHILLEERVFDLRAGDTWKRP